MSLPWNEKLNVISINPDMANRDDIARMATELSEAQTNRTTTIKAEIRSLIEKYEPVDVVGINYQVPFMSLMAELRELSAVN